jgi:hypothetical protein
MPMQRLTPRVRAIPAVHEIRDFALLWKRASRSRLTPVGPRPARRGTLRRESGESQIRWTRGRRSASWRG